MLKNITFALFFKNTEINIIHYMILEKIDKLLNEVNNLKANNAEEIEQLRLKYLSKKGEITALMADFRNVAADQKKAVGMKINELKQLALQKINELKEQNEVAEESADDFDLTRSAYPTCRLCCNNESRKCIFTYICIHWKCSVTLCFPESWREENWAY